MALVVEDGTGLATAESYASVAELQAHRPRSSLSIPVGASDAQIEAALIRATAAVDGLMGSRWPGLSETEDQALDWPRAQAWDRDGWPLTGLPVAVKVATMEAALVELNTAGALTEAQSRGGQIIREKVGPIETEYAKGAPAATVYPAIIQALSRIVRGGGGIVTERG